MTSIMTNTSAMVALQTLRSINNSLDSANNRISTGLKVNTAADNAAYWSIATTTRSDNGQLGAVKDALNLGAQTVNTATTAMNANIKTLQEVQAKLTAALSPNVDRGKIQTEIGDLLNRLKDTADSAVQAGENWLSTDSGAGNYVSDRKIVASFTRTDGRIEVGTVNVAVDSTRLYDKTTGAGPGTGDAAAIGTAAGTLDTAQGSYRVARDTYIAAKASYEAGTMTAASWTDAKTSWADAKTDYKAALGTYTSDVKATGLGAAAGAFDAAKGTFKTASEDWAAAQVAWESSDKGTAAQTVYATAKSAFDAAKDEYDFELGLANDKAVSAVDGTGGALNKAIGVVAKDEQGVLKNYELSVDTIDISAIQNQDLSKLRAYIQVVDKALTSMTDAATTLGSVSSRISGQTTFVESLIKANEQSIGALVDANMEEESTKLKALQVQQQLGVQSLSIANSAGQNILSLFR